MTPSEIKQEIIRLSQKMLDKDYVMPKIWVAVGWLGEDLVASLNFRTDADEDNKSDFVYGTAEGGFAGVLAKVEAKIDALPSNTDTKRSAFIASVGKLIEKGRDIGIEVDFLNPLTDMMTKLSTNILEKK